MTAEELKSIISAGLPCEHLALFGGWEGNWMAYNMAHDVKLPKSTGPMLGFFMYPAAEDKTRRFNSYAPDDFKYQISAREIMG